jgi:spore maturation protein CgeB
MFFSPSYMPSPNLFSSAPSGTLATATRRLLIIGNVGGTNVGGSLAKQSPGSSSWTIDLLESNDAMRGPALLRRLRWHLFDRQPLRLERFSATVVQWCQESQPAVLLTTGLAPVHAAALRQIGALGIRRVNYLTDDPWNPAHRARWFLHALSEYDLIATPRRATFSDLQRATKAAVRFVPFAYDPALFFPVDLRADEREELDADVVFAGGADADRVPYIAALRAAGLTVALYGSYWERYPEMQPLTRGQIGVEHLRKAVAAARLALCLVRRANRDGHSMRTFEVPAVGACMLVEDTTEHREIFGDDGQAVVYFSRIEEMVSKARWLLEHPAERERLKRAAHHLIVTGQHTYADRLQTMLAAALTGDSTA